MESIKVGYHRLTSSWGRCDQMLYRKMEGKGIRGNGLMISLSYERYRNFLEFLVKNWYKRLTCRNNENINLRFSFFFHFKIKAAFLQSKTLLSVIFFICTCQSKIVSWEKWFFKTKIVLYMILLTKTSFCFVCLVGWVGLGWGFF